MVRRGTLGERLELEKKRRLSVIARDTRCNFRKRLVALAQIRALEYRVSQGR